MMIMFLLGLVQSVWVHRNVEIEEDEEIPPQQIRRYS